MGCFGVLIAMMSIGVICCADYAPKLSLKCNCDRILADGD